MLAGFQRDFGMNSTRWGRAERTDFTAHQDQPLILNDAKCFWSRVHLFNLSFLFLASSSPSLCTFLFYLFKAELYGLYQAWKGKQMLLLTEITGFYFTAVYLFISRDLFSCCLFFFFFPKK